MHDAWSAMVFHGEAAQFEEFLDALRRGEITMTSTAEGYEFRVREDGDA
jgi:hypothetical protein